MTKEADAELTGFVLREFPRLVGALDLYVGDVAVAEELAQEALLRACSRWERVRLLDSPGGWTYRVALNLATSHLRRRQAELRARRRLPLPATVAPDIDTAEREAVRAAVLALPAQQRSAVILRYFLDMTAVATAEALSSTPQAVRAATARAMTRLRADLGDEALAGALEEATDA